MGPFPAARPRGNFDTFFFCAAAGDIARSVCIKRLCAVEPSPPPLAIPPNKKNAECQIPKAKKESFGQL